MALTHGGSSPVSLTPRISGIVRYSGSPAIAIATSRPPTPMASMPSDPAAQVCESEPASEAPGRPNRCMCTGCETPLPGRENHSPNRWQAERRNRWSAMFRSSDWSRLWSTYCTDTSVRTRSRARASSSSITMVPVASWVSVWSIRSPISVPGVISPSARWDLISFCATFSPMRARLPGCAPVTPRHAPAPFGPKRSENLRFPYRDRRRTSLAECPVGTAGDRLGY